MARGLKGPRRTFVWVHWPPPSWMWCGMNLIVKSAMEVSSDTILDTKTSGKIRKMFCKSQSVNLNSFINEHPIPAWRLHSISLILIVLTGTKQDSISACGDWASSASTRWWCRQSTATARVLSQTSWSARPRKQVRERDWPLSGHRKTLPINFPTVAGCQISSSYRITAKTCSLDLAGIIPVIFLPAKHDLRNPC